MKNKKENLIQIIDERGEIKPDESTAIPNDLMDKYMKFFKGKQFLAVMDLIQQAYKAGLHIGREEKTKYYEKILDEIYQK